MLIFERIKLSITPTELKRDPKIVGIYMFLWISWVNVANATLHSGLVDPLHKILCIIFSSSGSALLKSFLSTNCNSLSDEWFPLLPTELACCCCSSAANLPPDPWPVFTTAYLDTRGCSWTSTDFHKPEDPLTFSHPSLSFSCLFQYSRHWWFSSRASMDCIHQC